MPLFEKQVYKKLTTYTGSRHLYFTFRLLGYHNYINAAQIIIISNLCLLKGSVVMCIILARIVQYNTSALIHDEQSLNNGYIVSYHNIIHGSSDLLHLIVHSPSTWISSNFMSRLSFMAKNDYNNPHHVREHKDTLIIT